MSCPTCNGPMVWQGTIPRGRMECPACKPAPEAETTFVFPHGQVSLVLARYYTEVASFHHKWCVSRLPGNSRPGIRSDPKLCDCGFDQVSPHSQADIEKREIHHYGSITP